MSLLHKLLLYASLGFLGISLVVPGLIEIIKNQPGSAGLTPDTIDAKNQFRALNGMMTGIGLLALAACFDLEKARYLVLALGGILLLVFMARMYSILTDGLPGLMTGVYAAVELLLAIIFLMWPPVE